VGDRRENIAPPPDLADYFSLERRTGETEQRNRDGNEERVFDDEKDDATTTCEHDVPLTDYCDKCDAQLDGEDGDDDGDEVVGPDDFDDDDDDDDTDDDDDKADEAASASA
jgi:hypothetical protein